MNAVLNDWLARIVQGGLFYTSELGWSIFSDRTNKFCRSFFSTRNGRYKSVVIQC